jgi:hypothetical protein
MNFNCNVLPSREQFYAVVLERNLQAILRSAHTADLVKGHGKMTVNRSVVQA